MPVTVINMIPNSLSGETQRDSEPNVSVNPANPQQIAASAFTPDPANSGNAPIFVSTDGGNTWVLNVKLPGGNKTGDTSLRFATTSGVLYAGILRSDTAFQLNILRDPNFTGAGLMTTLVNRANDDQPWVEAVTGLGGTGRGNDHLYVSSNDISQRTTTGFTATVEQSLDAATAPPPAGIAAARLEVRPTANLGGASGSQDGPSVRTAVHHDGTVYGAYLGWRTFATPNVTDVVVVRDNDFGAGATPYADPQDGGDGLAGVRVVIGVQSAPLNTTLGTQRIGSHIAVAVDPRDSQTVYLAWADGATAAAYTVHLRRSTDGGQNWTGDLRTIASATNPCVAINVHGKVGFMYQQLGNPGTGNRWRTHLEISSDGFATAPTDFLLADVPDANGTYAGTNPIGDYANLIALGKNVVGVFSANNTPNNANFPNGVTYQRNANFGTNTLLANDNVTPVTASIDPFFVRYIDVAAGDDFYVRDWTDSAVSGDTGLEPSTHPVFYATSDVWNRRGTLPGPFPNDQPSNEDAGNGAGNLGDNWAFARIRKNAPGTGTKDVTAHFLVSKLGTGSNYVDDNIIGSGVTFGAPDPTVTFNAADLGPIITPALPWHLDAVVSTHLCLAVEISAPGDPFVAPSLLGRAPGWPTTDLAVINDNNKAQRNMGLSTTSNRGAGLTDDFYAIVHNAATFRRDVVIRLNATPEVLRRLPGAQIVLVGGEKTRFKPGTEVVLPAMDPGENRWIGLSLTPPKGKTGEVLFVTFDEMVGGVAVNGFGLGVRIATDAEVVRAKLKLHCSVFTRLAAGFDVHDAEEQAKLAEKLAAAKTLDTKLYVDFLRSQSAAITRIIATFMKGRKDVFRISDALKVLSRAALGKKWEDAAAAHASFLNRLDSFLTSLQLERGDPADILQNVLWQQDLYRRLPSLRKLECAKEIAERSRAFVQAFGGREGGTHGYQRHIEGLLHCFQDTAKALPNLGLEKRIEEITRQIGDQTSLQKAHRQYLLVLEALRTRAQKGSRGRKVR
ncbi:MAG TPA: hypothetical protein VE422_46785 [Terriglobia bacterium]|nr:hypothetical protein [Terriglobia bacterium]